MKVLPFTIVKSGKDTILLQEDLTDTFYGLLHQHEEFQISYIKQGKGSLIVGDTLNRFETGDVVVLGGNLPHVFKNNSEGHGQCHMLSVFFTPDSFGSEFFKIEELKSLISFFRKAENGFKITQPSKGIIDIFESLQKASKLDRFLLFLQLLKRVNAGKYEVLSSFYTSDGPTKYTDNEGQRMNAVFQYTMEHFRDKITLDAIAKEAAMTPNAFCKYFKNRTRKTYMSFLNEIRVEEACKLLKEQPEMSVAEVAEQSGFRNISNFNRIFKGLIRETPFQYRSKIVR
ncbi:AraC family transcriptional regulator [Aureisphaera galaxeae]|uniref:AraC family transcriptional regulator n=1 Tax=Aureisphaera galaxeae TaxID=1538023 RepID=UPI0023509C93|nr:AraC family transcriptional regulator [Aureisphaera galaxeae]MDC8002881.1 AraC family transcriptional regulator [Aureisphaera galaxeae]